MELDVAVLVLDIDRLTEVELELLELLEHAELALEALPRIRLLDELSVAWILLFSA